MGPMQGAALSRASGWGVLLFDQDVDVIVNPWNCNIIRGFQNKSFRMMIVKWKDETSTTLNLVAFRVGNRDRQNIENRKVYVSVNQYPATSSASIVAFSANFGGLRSPPAMSAPRPEQPFTTPSIYDR